VNGCPTSWVEVRLQRINEFSGRTVDPSAQPSRAFELYSVPAFPARSPEKVPGREIGSTKQTVEPDDVLICKINPRINRVWRVEVSSGLPQIASSEWIAVRNRQLNSRYLQHYFSSPSFRELICDGVTGVGGSLTRAQPKRVAEFPVPIAPLAEQKRIADKLDAVFTHVDACRDRLDRVPAILKRFRQAIVEAASGGMLTEDWRQTVGLTSGWCTGTLSDLFNGKPRNGYSPRTVERITPVRSLTLTATTSGRFKPEHFKYIDEAIPDNSHLWLQPGDILIQRANTLEYVGTSALYDGPPSAYIYPDLMMKARAGDLVMPKFLLLVLQSRAVRTHFRENATGTAGNMPKINQQTVLTAPASWPARDEQAEIVRRVDSLFALADTLEARLAAARTHVDRLTPALLSKAFRGELVPQDPNDEPANVLLARIAAQRATTAVEPTSRPPRKARVPRAPKEVAIMTKSRQDEDVMGQPYLANLLRRVPAPTSAETLFKMAELPVADFYKQLAWEVDKGYVQDNQTSLEPGHAAG
jgi:type I restriction enzyme, S subunit